MLRVTGNNETHALAPKDLSVPISGHADSGSSSHKCEVPNMPFKVAGYAKTYLLL